MLETLTRTKTWGDRSGVLSDHGFEYFDIAVKGGDIRNKHPMPSSGEATLDQVLRNNRSFLQIFGRNGAESDQVATLSFGLSGGVETIEALAESISQGLGSVEIRHYADDQQPNQINLFIESDDLDPMFLLGRMIDAPKDVYANIEGLRAQVEAQELRRKTLIESPRGKGRFYEDIFYQRIDGNVTPLERVDGSAEFGFGYIVRGGELWNQGQSMTCLAIDERVDSGMRDSLLEPQTFLAETPKGKRRFVVKIDAHPTTYECCPRATNYQMGEANFHKGPNFESSAVEIRLNNENLFHDLLNPSLIKSEKDKEGVCSKCNMPKNGSSEGGKCSCKDS